MLPNSVQRELTDCQIPFLPNQRRIGDFWGAFRAPVRTGLEHVLSARDLPLESSVT